MNKEKGFIQIGCVVILVAFLLFVIGFNLYYALNSRYWISDGGDTTLFTDYYTEKDGCIYFRSQFGFDVRQCNNYRIEDMKNE